MPSQAEADAWADRKTLGLIRKFPMEIDEFTRIVLASALATKVKWEVPFDVVPAAEHCGVASPWNGAVSRLLWDGSADSRAMIARTDAAGVVAVHCAVAREDLTVVSVSGAPEVDRIAMLAGAYEVAATVCGEWGKGACSLFDLPLGAGHSWEISEREVPVFVPEPRIERVAGAALPAWHVEGTLDLTRSSPLGRDRRSMLLRQTDRPPARRRVPGHPGRRRLLHAVRLRGRSGDGARDSHGRPAPAAGARRSERTAVLRFDHPYAAVAIAGRPAGVLRGMSVGSPGPDSPFPGLPLFAAWVHEPIEPEDQPPS